MENENLIPEEEESSILTLTDENGVDNDFEYLDCIEYKGKEYLVLMPVDTVETEIVILEVEPVDGERELPRRRGREAAQCRVRNLQGKVQGHPDFRRLISEKRRNLRRFFTFCRKFTESLLQTSGIFVADRKKM